jgi:TonB family protein
VILKLTISASGEVTDVQLVRGDEPFAAAAMEAVRTWRYRPAQLDGRSVAAVHMVSIPFRIRS